MKQQWWKKGGVYLYLEGVRVASRATDDLREADVETEAEEQRGNIE